MKKEKDLFKRILEDRTETFESETHGFCSCCGKEYVKVNKSNANPDVQDFRIRDVDDTSTAWSHFRCRNGSDLEKNFTPGKPTRKKGLLARLIG